MKNQIKIKRVYDTPLKEDGFRIFVDRLWPRGLNKNKAEIHLWLKDIAPSNTLRKWFAHDSQKWIEFKKRYFKELAGKKDILSEITGKTAESSVTLLYSAKDKKFNNAVALEEYIKIQKVKS